MNQKKTERRFSVYLFISNFWLILFLKTGKNYYLLVFLEKCKYVVKEKKIPKYIIDDIEISSDFDKKNSDEDNYNEEKWNFFFIFCFFLYI